MSFSQHQGEHAHHDLRELALSEAQTKAHILDSENLFSNIKGSNVIEVTCFSSDTANVPATYKFSDCAQLTAHLTDIERRTIPQRPFVEIYTMHQADTWAPLSVSKDMISLLIDHYSLSAGFLHVLKCFRDRFLPTEEGFTGASTSSTTANQSEFGWVYKYSEKKQVTSGSPWRIRHTGIYQFYDCRKERSVLFIIHPSPAARFKIHLQEALQKPQVRCGLAANAMLVHPMLISMHLSSWRDYLEYYETLLLQVDMKPACTSFEKPLVTFNTLTEVRSIERNIVTLEPLLASFDSTVVGIREAHESLSKRAKTMESTLSMMSAIFDQFRKEAESYRRQANHLDRRAHSTAQSVMDSLNLGFQQLAKSQNRNTLILAKSAREDSDAIRAITLVTAFYLPFSFVATVFGMNLVDFDSETRNLTVSNQFWLYFVISIPLTAMTLAYWKWRMHLHREDYTTKETNRHRGPGLQKCDSGIGLA